MTTKMATKMAVKQGQIWEEVIYISAQKYDKNVNKIVRYVFDPL